MLSTDLAEVEAEGDTQARCMMIRQRANILNCGGKLKEAIVCFEEAGEIARKQGRVEDLTRAIQQ